jgi:hypothetical protein
MNKAIAGGTGQSVAGAFLRFFRRDAIRFKEVKEVKEVKKKRRLSCFSTVRYTSDRMLFLKFINPGIIPACIYCCLIINLLT